MTTIRFTLASARRVFLGGMLLTSAGLLVGEEPTQSTVIGTAFGMAAVAFQKGTQSAERVVDQSYEIVTRMNGYGLSGTAGGLAMPRCN
jgi:hypothetical protein